MISESMRFFAQPRETRPTLIMGRASYSFQATAPPVDQDYFARYHSGICTGALLFRRVPRNVRSARLKGRPSKVLATPAAAELARGQGIATSWPAAISACAVQSAATATPMPSFGEFLHRLGAAEFDK